MNRMTSGLLFTLAAFLPATLGAQDTERFRYMGLYAGMPVEEVVVLLKLPPDWRKWCRKPAADAESDNCHILGEWTGLADEGTTYTFGLDKDSEIARAVVIMQTFRDRDSAQHRYVPLVEAWQSIKPLLFLSGGSCGYHTRYTEPAYIAVIGTYCLSPDQSLVLDDMSPVSEVTLTVHMQYRGRK